MWFEFVVIVDKEPRGKRGQERMGMDLFFSLRPVCWKSELTRESFTSSNDMQSIDA